MSEVNRPGVQVGRGCRSGCGGNLVPIVTGFWILIVTIVVQGAVWLTGQAAIASTGPLPPVTFATANIINAVLISLPTLPLAFASRGSRGIASGSGPVGLMGRTWAIAAVFMALLAIPRLLPDNQTQIASAVQTVLALAASGLLLLAAPEDRRSVEGSAATRTDPLAGRLALAVAVALVASLPSLAWGALGSLLDVALDVAAGLALGLFAGLLIERSLSNPLARFGRAPSTAAALLAAALTLLVLGAGFGAAGDQILLALALPGLALALAGLSGASRGVEKASEAATRSTAEADASELEPRSTYRAWLPGAVLVGLVAAGLLALWDPDELSILLGAADILSWGTQAARWTFLLALGGGFAVVQWVRRSRPHVAVAAPLAVVGAVLAVAVYALIGQPGLYGERFFVILREQADLSEAGKIAERAGRLQAVYGTLVQHAERSQTGLRDMLERQHVGYRAYYLVNALEVEGGPLLRSQIAALPEVDRVLDSPQLRPLPQQQPVETGSARAPSDGPGDNIKAIGADRVWNELGVTGKGIVVGQSDSGAQGDHPALKNGYRGLNGGDDYNWLDPWNNTPSPVDIGGHGTHTLGIVLGDGGIGVAPDAEWFACVNLARNLGNPARYLDCMQFMLAPYPQKGDPFHDGDPSRAADVLNNSWGCPEIEGCDSGTLETAAAALRVAGTFIVSSAGNSGPTCATLTDPIAIYPTVFTVGAIDTTGALAFFSSRGPAVVDGQEIVKPDILAPGVDVLSAMPGSTYGLNTGTSMAGPHVAGVVALMWSANPRLIGDVDRTAKILIDTARPYTGTLDCSPAGSEPSNDAGYGIVDAYGAVKAAQAATQAASQ